MTKKPDHNSDVYKKDVDKENADKRRDAPSNPNLKNEPLVPPHDKPHKNESLKNESHKKKFDKNKSHNNKNQHQKNHPYRKRRDAPRYAALDLGTNNCRLLISSPRGKSMRIIDAYSQIVRLGENLSKTGELSQAAMERTIAVLKTCADKIKYRGVTHMRCVATQACRGARNGEDFLKRVQEEAGIALEIISAEEEARLAMNGCRDLFDVNSKAVLVFDIGGGSTEISWVKLPSLQSEEGEKSNHSLHHRTQQKAEIKAWFSLPFGVVNISERWGGREMSRETYDLIVSEVSDAVRAIGDSAQMKHVFEQGHAHLLGTSGTVTSIAGVHLKLDRYRRMAVDGLWLSRDNVYNVSERLRAMDFQARADEPCIGQERADLVICGCAILEGILKEWPSERIRVADRGLREGILVELGQKNNQKSRNRNRNKNRHRGNAKKGNAPRTPSSASS